VHRWIAVTAGVFLLSQIISGIVMILPGIREEHRNVRADYSSATVSPAQAVTAAGEAVADPALIKIAGRLIYQIKTRRGMRLVDAHSGEIFSVTPELAERIVRSEYETVGGPLQQERIDQYGGRYRRGPLPVYLIRAMESGNRYYVSAQDGSVIRDTNVGRVRAIIGGLHTFDIVPGIGSNAKLRKLALAGAATFGFSAVATGYCVAWLRRRKEQAG
jgi:hypothetical protein